MFKKIILFLGIVLFWGTINTSDRARIKYPFLEDYVFLGESESISITIPQKSNQARETVFLRSELYHRCGELSEVCVLRSEKGDLLGHMFIQYKKNHPRKKCDLLFIEVERNYLKKGYGRLMIDHLKKQALKNGCDYIELIAVPGVENFYARLEFDEKGKEFCMQKFYFDCNRALQEALLAKIGMPF